MGGDPLLGAAAGAAAGAIGGLFGGIGGNLGPLGNIARAGAVGAAAGAASGAIAGDPAMGALLGGSIAAANAVFQAIANGDLQKASDISQEKDGIAGKAAAEAAIGSSATRKGLVDAVGEGLDAGMTAIQAENFAKDYRALIPMLSKSLPRGTVAYYNIFVDRHTGHITKALPFGTHDVRAYLSTHVGELYKQPVRIYGTGEREVFIQNPDTFGSLRRRR